MVQTERQIAEAFNRAYEDAWNRGSLDELSNLYADDAILVGYQIVNGRESIRELLSSIRSQGFTDIAIRTVEAHRRGEYVLVASEYDVSDPIGDRKMTAKSSQVLMQDHGLWGTVMHTAT